MQRPEIERLLPEVFQRTARPGTPLFALLEVMSGLQAPAEEALECLDAMLDPRRAPAPFVYLLARWLNLEQLYREDASKPPRPALMTPGLGHLRELVAEASSLSQWRGTARGLKRFLEIATGIHGFLIDEASPGIDGEPRSFHIHVTAPAAAAPHRALIRRIIELEKPAYVTYELEIAAPDRQGEKR